MSKLLAVAARELRERWLLFPGALASGCFPLVLPAFGVERELMPVVGAVGAILLGVAAGLIAGASMLARDAANGRLGFLFSRPVSWPVIWGGKWLAALVLVVLGGFLAAIPWMVAFPLTTVGGHHGGSWLRAMADDPQGAVFFFLVIVLAVGLANFGATLYRSRSPWAALDLVLLLAALWATRRYVAPLWLYGALAPLTEWSTAVALLPLVLGLLAGSVAQVAIGRTDVQRAHRALSLGFWAVVAFTLASAAGYWAWVRSAGPADVNVHAGASDPSGRWVYVEGSGRHHGGWYPHGLLIDTAGGRYARLSDPLPDRSRVPVGLLFSADGRTVALPHADGQGAAIALYDLAGAAPRLSEVALESSPPPTWATAFALSPSAAYVFMAHESGASLFALPSGRRLATTTIGPGWRPAVLRFLGEGEARAWLVPWTEVGPAPGRAEVRVVDLAVDGRSRASAFPTAKAFDRTTAWRGVSADAGGGRLLTQDAGIHLRDGASGDVLATLAEGGEWLSTLFLADGRIVVGAGLNAPASSAPRVSLRVFDRDGAKLGETPLDLWPWGLSVGPEVAPGRVVVSTIRTPYLAEDAIVVDVGDLRVVDRLFGLRPGTGFWGVSGPAAVSRDVGPTSVHFFRDVEGRVVRIDFATGERKTVAGPGAPRGQRSSARCASGSSRRRRGPRPRRGARRGAPSPGGTPTRAPRGGVPRPRPRGSGGASRPSP
jgi:hypothetical protein